MDNVRVLLTGGGTGGHIYPLVAVAQKLRGIDIHYFGNPGLFRDYLQRNGIKIHKIASSKWRRYFSLYNLLDIFKFLWSIFQSLWKVFWVMPDAAFSKGGPGSLAIIFACRFYRIPIIIHESDAISGLANRISARYAEKIELAFEEAGASFENIGAKTGIKVVGQPVRSELLVAGGDSSQAKNSFGFTQSLPVLLVMGGSRGSEKINEFVLNNFEAIVSKFQVLHSVGLNNYSDYRNEFEFISKDINPYLLKRYYFVSYFEQNLASAYDAADLIVSRAGAGAIFETAAKGKPSILIPLPNSANGHQDQNAYIYTKTGAAVVVEEENLLINIFINEALKIVANPTLMEKMSVAAKSFFKSDAADAIAEDILNLILQK